MNEMIVKEETALVTHSAAPLGFDNFTAADLALPRLRLLQGLSDAVSEGKGAVGQFQDSVTEEILGDSLEIVLMGMKNGAVYFEAGKGMICKSNDGITSINGDTCSKCPFGEYWNEWKNKKPSKCAGTKEFMAVTRKTLLGEEMRPLVVTFSKMSAPAGRKLAALALFERFKKHHLFQKSYSLGSEKTKNDKGSFAVFTINQGTELSSDEMKEALNWYNTFSNSNVTIVEEPDTSFDTKSFDEV